MAADALGEYIGIQGGLPEQRHPLEPRVTGTIELDDLVIEKIVYAAEPFSSVPAHLYIPRNLRAPAPAMILACDHGGSKSVFYNQYAAQLYAKAGVVVLAADPLGQEERDPYGRIGVDAYGAIAREAQRLGRPIVGKLVWDLMRGIDYLHLRPELVDGSRIGVAGHALGAAVAMYLAVLDERVRLALAATMYFDNSDPCVTGMYQLIWRQIDYAGLLAAAAPRCATLVLQGEYAPVRLFEYRQRNDSQQVCERAKQLYDAAGAGDKFDWRLYEDAGHRPYFLSREALLWIERHFGLPRWNRENVLALPTVRLADWAWENGVTFYEQLLKTELHYGGMLMPDAEVRYHRPCRLACLSNEERRGPTFRTDNWLKHIAEMPRQNLGTTDG